MAPTPRFGLGFRTPHFAALCERPRGVDWLELLSDNFLGAGGTRRAQLERLRADHPVALHGVGLGIANDEAPSADYVAALRALADSVQPLFVSDHLCWTGLAGASSHDLLPVASTREVLALVSERVARVQDALGRRLLLENASAYVKFRADELSEAELLAALCERTGCGVLLDVNNLFVNASNLGADPHAALATLAPRHVAYLHVAGHAALPGLRVDTHGAAVQGEVWGLFEHAARRFSHAPVVLERDDAIPPLPELVAELDVARERWTRAQRAEADAPHADSARRSGARPPALWSEPGAFPRSMRPSNRHRAPATWRETQRAFWSGIAKRRVIRGADALPAALDARVPVAPQRGLRVYRDALARLPERVLAANLPTLARVLSRRDFAALSAAFARAHPVPPHDTVSFGAPLADFLERFALSDGYEVPAAALADIARLEQAQLEAQEAPDDDATLAPEALAALRPEDWEGARFEFSAALRIVVARWEVLSAVRAATASDRLPLPKRADSAYLVTRVGGAVKTDPLEPVGARALAALARGASFRDACEAAGGELAAHAAATALARAAALGAVTAVTP
jgi:uncharacterized protein (UPF0276 family)